MLELKSELRAEKNNLGALVCRWYFQGTKLDGIAEAGSVGDKGAEAVGLSHLESWDN